MTEVIMDPAIRCCDVWPPGTLTQSKMQAYKTLIDNKRIRITAVIWYKSTDGTVLVEYLSPLPHRWILDHLREAADKIRAQGEAEQIRMEV